MITNPENLSKDRLKAELKKRGIAFNASENKKYYVDLYRKKILSPEIARSEFSDDDIKSSPTPTKRKVSTLRPPPAGRDLYSFAFICKVTSHKTAPSRSGTLEYVKNLENNELVDELVAFGVDPGPINALTRSVYERKLVRLLEEDGEERK